MALDGFTMKYGQMVVTRGGREMAMLDDMKMANGILVMSDGVVIRPNGNRFSIHDGDYLSLDGVLYRGGFPATPVTTTVTSSTTTVVAPVAPMTVVVATPAASDCILMRSGQVIVFRDGRSYAMGDSSMRLTDGTVVTRDGSINTPDGRMSTMREGDSITLDGRIRRSGM